MNALYAVNQLSRPLGNLLAERLGYIEPEPEQMVIEGV